MDVKKLWQMPPWDWPSDAAGVLLRTLGDDAADESDRLRAVEMAGNLIVINDDLAGALLTIVHDSTAAQTLRGAAAIALGPVLEHSDLEGFDDPEDVSLSDHVIAAIRDSLHRVYQDAEIPKEVRRRALEGSVRAQEDWHAGAVQVAYDTGDNDWRLTAVFCMRFVAGFDDEILDALQSDHPELHYEAVIAAGNFGVEAAWPYIHALVRSEETEKPLLLGAIAATASIRPEMASETLSPLADSGDDDIVDAVDAALSIARGYWDEGTDIDLDELDDDGLPMNPLTNGGDGGTTFH